jgi:hypothetical protein
MNRLNNLTLLWITIFAIAMALLESAVVIYMRELYFTGPSLFPLPPVKPSILKTELLREAGTILMLLSVAAISGKGFALRFAWFIYAFAIWDIFYYLFLYWLIGWPGSLFDWDVLFMIPVTWTGPVLAPVINSLFMILIAGIILIWVGRGMKVRFPFSWWVLIITGSCLILYSYMIDYVNFMLQFFSLREMILVTDSAPIQQRAGEFIPERFTWWAYLTGCVIQLAGIAELIRTNRKTNGKRRDHHHR